jgi:hypothetical protein
MAKGRYWASTKIGPKRPQDVTPWFLHSLTLVLWPVLVARPEPASNQNTKG